MIYIIVYIYNDKKHDRGEQTEETEENKDGTSG